MADVRIPLLLLVLLALFTTQPILSAQEDPSAKPAQDPETPDPEIERIKANALRRPSLADPQVLIDAVKDDFRHWPRHARGEDAVKKILRKGKEAIPLLMELLDGRDYRMKPAVAYLLGKLVTEDEERKKACEKVKPLLFDRNLKGSVWNLLESLHDIDANEAEALSVEFLVSDNSAFRKAAFGLLHDLPVLTKADELYVALKTVEGDSRRKIFQLLLKEPGERLDAAALDLLGDPFPSLAQDVSDYLAHRKNQRVIDSLKSRLTFEPERPFAFALCTLVSLEDNYDIELLDKKDAERIEKFLSYREPLFRLSAAAALANLCYRSGSEEDVNMIRNRLVPIFMDVFLKNQYFKDFAYMLDIAAAGLTRLTGAPFGPDLTFWHEWWNTKGRDFVGNQFLITVDTDMYPRLAVRCSGYEFNKGAPIVVAGEELIYDRKFKRDPWTVFLPAEGMKALVDYLYTQGFFERRALTASSVEAGGTKRIIEMKADAKSRIVMAEAATDTVFDAMHERVRGVFMKELWQLLYPRGSDFGKWWEARYPWWKEQEDAEKKTDRLLQDLIETIQVLPDPIVVCCLNHIQTLGTLGQCLDESEAMVLLSRLGEKHYKIDATVKAMVDMILASKNKDLLDPVLLYLYGSYGEGAMDLISHSLLSMNCVEESLKSPRWFVRGAAAQACAKEGRYIVPQLIPLLDDERVEVRFAAIRALPKLPTEQSINALKGVMTDGDPKTRTAVILTIDSIDADWVIDFYAMALQGNDATIWQSALEGLSRFPSRVSADVVFRFLDNRDLTSEPARVALDALFRMGGAPARDVLYSLLDGKPEKNVQLKIVTQLAFLGDLRIFEPLQDCLLEKDLRQRALQGMAYLLVKDFGAESWKYRELWERNPGKDQAFFLRSALGLPEPDPSDKRPRYEGIPVESLIKALRHDQWPVRLAALRILNEGTGKRLGKLSVDSSEAEVNRVAEAWETWWKERG